MLCMIFLERLLIKGELNNFIYSEVVLDNQICYKVDLNIYDTKNSEQFDSSLTFLVDTNPERQFGSEERDTSPTGDNILDHSSHRSTETIKTMIYVGTLGKQLNVLEVVLFYYRTIEALRRGNRFLPRVGWGYHMSNTINH